MDRIVFGADYLDEHCVIMANINVNSPLVYDGAVTEVIRHYAAAGQGMVICPFILGGACLLYTSPSPRDKRQSRMPSSA